MLKETIKEVKKNLFKRGYTEVQDTSVKTDSKAQARYRIEKEVFDLEDSVADNAKMISLIISVLYRLYDTMPETQKETLSPEDRGMIEAVFTQFKGVQTRADVQFQSEGMDMVTKILDRQGKIGTIVQ